MSRTVPTAPAGPSELLRRQKKTRHYFSAKLAGNEGYSQVHGLSQSAERGGSVASSANGWVLRVRANLATCKVMTTFHGNPAVRMVAERLSNFQSQPAARSFQFRQSYGQLMQSQGVGSLSQPTATNPPTQTNTKQRKASLAPPPRIACFVVSEPSKKFPEEVVLR
jgi:hypothetical protein